ncbi:MAG: hypothetical protein H6832_06315 [Planctomycetes bacterium]|nr:hypothetical protein [Planctomycetota bacterium]MCB9918000.1 hypothetical protein [Planctomycetota bacterium]
MRFPRIVAISLAALALVACTGADASTKKGDAGTTASAPADIKTVTFELAKDP